MRNKDGHILLHVERHVATITISNPDKRNALTPGMRRDLIEVVRRCERDADVRVVIVTGAGDAFCAGGDIGHLRDLKSREDEAGFVQLLDEGCTLVNLIRRAPKPVIAMVNGPAFGAGFFVAIACDLRLCAASASFGAPFIKLGLGPDWGGTFLLPRLIGTAKALEMLYTGDGVSAQEAVEIGLANHRYPDDQLASKVIALATQLAERPADVLARHKLAIYHSLNNTFETTADLERRFQLQNFRSPQFAEGIAAFLEKRPPRFD